MASGDNEHKMLFDIRGKRRHVVKVVYAILALLMGLSLFLLAGPGIGGIFSTGNSVSNAVDQFEEQTERIEQRLKKDPQDSDLLLALTKAQINTGYALGQRNPETGALGLTVESRQQLEKASATWSDYLKATDEPSAGGAQVVAPALFSLAEISSTPEEIEANVKAAAAAQQLVADQRPNLNSLSSLAIYKYFSFDFAGAEKAEAEAKKFTRSKFERENLENQLEETSKRARSFQGQVAAAKKAAEAAGAAGNSEAGKEALQSPLGGLGGTSLSE